MADIKYEVAIDDKASATLQKIQNNVSKATAAFGKFQTAVAGLGLAALQRSAIGYADAIKDISDATGVAIANVLGFQKAVSAAGGNVEKAQASIIKFNLSIADAAAGSLQAQDAFAQIGISLNDLRTLSEQDLFTKAIQGLGDIADTSLRAKLSNELFGKTLKGVNLKGLADDYLKAAAASRKYADDIRKGAELNDKLDAAFSRLKLAVLSAMAPTIEFFNNLDENQVNRFIDAVVKIGGSLAALVAIGKSIQVIGTILTGLGTAAATAWAVFGGGARLAAAGLAAVTAALPAVVAGFGAVFAALSSVSAGAAAWAAALAAGTAGVPAAIGAIIIGLTKMLGVIGVVATAAYALNEAWKMAFDEGILDTFANGLEKLVTDNFPRVAAAINKLGEFMGMAPGKMAAQGSKAGQQADVRKVDNAILAEQARLEKATADEAARRAAAEREVQDALEKQRREISRISIDFAKQLDSKASQLQLETDLVGKSERQRDLMSAIADLSQKTADEVEKLRRAQADLTDEQRRGGLGEAYQRQIDAVQALGKAEQIRLAALVDGLSKAKALEEFRLFGIKQQQDAEDKLLAIQRDIADIGLTDIEKKYRDIVRAADDSAKAAIRAEEARRGEKLNPQEIEAYYRKAREGVGGLLDATRKLNDESRSFSSGWRKAFNDYLDNATNAAQQATRLFERFTQGLEDAIVNFAKTGKFEWKNFVASMAEELLRSQIKQTLASVMQIQNPFGSGGSIGDMFGGLFGSLLGAGGTQRGQSATSPLFVVDVSAGKGFGGMMGPQLPGGVGGGGIFDSIGKVFTGVKDAVGGVVTGIGDAIGGVANSIGSIFSGGGGGSLGSASDLGGGGGLLDSITSGISSLFDGWFANGGQIGAGKFGIVGERGPELVSGPASVTPLGGSTNVVYNINAVDAPSFQALVSQNPSFIYAVTEQGRKSFAGGR